LGKRTLERLHLRALRAVENAGIDHLAQQGDLVVAQVATGMVGVGRECGGLRHGEARGRWSGGIGQRAAAARPRSSSKVVTVSAASATLVFQAVTRGWAWAVVQRWRGLRPTRGAGRRRR